MQSGLVPHLRGDVTRLKIQIIQHFLVPHRATSKQGDQNTTPLLHSNNGRQRWAEPGGQSRFFFRHHRRCARLLD